MIADELAVVSWVTAVARGPGLDESRARGAIGEPNGAAALPFRDGGEPASALSECDGAP